MAQQAIGVLVGSPLPGAVGVAEKDLHVQGRADLPVQRHLGSLVPGQGVAQQGGQVLHLADDSVLDLSRVVPVGQVQEDREPGAAFHQGADGALIAGPHDQVALPVAGYGPVLHLGGPLADHDHGLTEAGPSFLARRPGPAPGPPLAQGLLQV